MPRFREAFRAVQCALAALLLVAAFVSPGSAATVTIDATKVTSIYTQPNFGSNPITINVLATAIIHDTSLLNINSAARFSSLMTAGPDAPATKIVDAFFVDSITYCGGPGSNIVGCGIVNAPGLAVDSTFAASDTKEVDLAHELGHNLGLSHISDAANLMNPVLLGGTTLTSSQISTIFLSSLVQGDARTGFFIDLRPVLVAATTPLPASLPLFAGGLSAVVIVARRRRRKAAAS